MLSILLPVFNGQKTLTELTEQIISVMSDSGGDWELIFIDDCSTDGSLELIKQLAEKRANIGWLSFKENRGQQTAVLCGLRESRGDFVITMDDDLEHPTELIPELQAELGAALKGGCDAVYAVPETGGSSGGRLRDIFFTLVLKKPSGLRIGSYRILTRAAARRIAEALQPFVYVSAEFFRGGFQAAAITYKPAARPAPAEIEVQSRYSFRGRVRLYLRLVLWYAPIIGAVSRRLSANSAEQQYTIASRGGCL